MFRQEFAENDRRSIGRREGFCGESCLFEKPLYELSCLRHSQVLSRDAGLLTEDSQFFDKLILVSVDMLRNLSLPCVDSAESFGQRNPCTEQLMDPVINESVRHLTRCVSCVSEPSSIVL